MPGRRKKYGRRKVSYLGTGWPVIKISYICPETMEIVELSPAVSRASLETYDDYGTGVIEFDPGDPCPSCDHYHRADINPY